MNWSSKWPEPKSELPLFNEQEREEFISKVEKRASIQLGNKTIAVTVVGDLGLDFCEPGEKDEGWNIYHLPTLACFSSAVPLAELIYTDSEVNGEYTYDKQPLLNWMAKVQEQYPTSWIMLRGLTPETYLSEGNIAKDIIQKWCLSVKVE